jgi:hypothetical protein
MSTLSVSGDSSLQQLYSRSCDLTSIDLTACSNLTFLSLTENTLSTIDIADCSNLGFCYIPYNHLTTTVVNNVLEILNGFGLTNGAVNVAGQSPLAPPSGGGITAATSLRSKGWTVNTD